MFERFSGLGPVTFHVLNTQYGMKRIHAVPVVRIGESVNFDTIV